MNRRGRHARLPLLIGLLLLLALIPFALYRGSQVPEAEAAWWNPSWKYRQRIDVTNPNSTDLADFQVSFTLDTASLISAGKLQAGCQDIRITDVGGKELPIWIAENNPGCNSVNTRIWVKMPRLPQSGTTLFAYYGNAGAAVSLNHNGEQVFEFFDDFSDGNSDGWTEGDWAGSVAANGGRSSVYGNGNAANQTLETISGSTSWDDYIVELDLYANSLSANHPGIIFRAADTANYEVCYLRPHQSETNGSISCRPVTNGSLGAEESGITVISHQTWTHVKVAVSGSTGNIFVDDMTTSKKSFLIDRSTGAIGLFEHGATGFFDNVFVRRYASNDPIFSLASEETGPGPVAYWKFDEGTGQIVFDSASHSSGNELLVDGDMEAENTAAWTASTGTYECVLTKETASPHSGSRSIRITPVNNAVSYATQAVLQTGMHYRVTGYARSGSTGTPTLSTLGSAGVFWSGTTSTEWQYFDEVFVAQSNNFWLRNATSQAGAYVEFDDITVKAVSSSNQGTITGATWANEDQCVSGKCLSFDGVDDYVAATNIETANFSSSDAFTLSAWVNPSTTGENGYVVGKNTIGRGYGLYWSGGSDAIALASGVNYAEYISEPVFTDDNAWVHVVVVFNNGSVSYYKNAQPSGTYEGHSFSTPTSGDNVVIGNRNGGSVATTYFAGLIDEPKIFPYALTEDQIKVEYNLGAAAVMGTGPTVAPPAGGTLSDSLVAHWAFDEQYGQTAHDKVGNNHGTFGASTSPGSDDPTWKPAGECKVNGCLGFDGGDFVDLTGLTSTSQTYTFSFWMKSSGSPAQYKYFFDSQSGRLVLAHQIGVVSGRIGIANPNWVDLGAAPLDGIWHYIAYVLDASSSTVSLYVDGKTYGTGSYSGINLGGATRIGNYYASATTGFQGSLDEFKIYNTALTADQIKQDMNAGASVAYSVGSEEADELADGAGAPPIAEWKFDEKQGTVAYDSSGNANDSTVNGATWKSGCQQGACLEFDGANDNVLVSSLSPNITGKTLTMNAWIELKNSGIQRAISASGTSTSFGFNGFNLYVHTRTSLGDDVNTPYMSLPTNCQAGWHYFSITWDTTLPSDNVKVYCDATKVGSGSLSNALDGDFNISSMMIGYGSSDQSIDGRIDHVRIYNYARTPAQIAYDYNRGAPVAHWKFDECEGTVAHDASGNENHGTINIGATGTQTTAGTCSTSGAWANGASGKFEGSLNFDGSNDYISLSNPNSIPIGGSAYTISAWIFANTMGNRGIVGWGNFGTANQVNALRLSATGIVNYWWANDLIVTTGDITGAWHHLVALFDGTTRIIYLDGAEVGRRTAGGLDIPSASNFQIGKTNVSEYFDGQIDDLRIYNYALSPAQIQKVMNEGLGVRYGPLTGNQ